MEKPELGTTIELLDSVTLTFSLKYLVNFCKASGLSNTVTLSLSNEVPLLVEYARHPYLCHAELSLMAMQLQDGGWLRQILPGAQDWR